MKGLTHFGIEVKGCVLRIAIFTCNVIVQTSSVLQMGRMGRYPIR